MATPRWSDVAAMAISEHKAQQAEGELTALLCLLASDIRPRVVLEIGAADGGTAWAWSCLPSVDTIISVDLEPVELEKCMSRDGVNTIMVSGNSLLNDTIDAVLHITDVMRPDMVFIDGCHDLESATSDMENYGCLVKPGGVIVMHDTQGWPGRTDFAVDQVFRNYYQDYTKTEIVSVPGGPCGTGIIWM